MDDVPGDDVPRAAGKGWVGRTGVLQLLPLARSVHCPIQSETESQKQVGLFMSVEQTSYHYEAGPLYDRYKGLSCKSKESMNIFFSLRESIIYPGGVLHLRLVHQIL